jgi:hypothetical protein
MHPDAPYFISLLCLMPDDFTCQGESPVNPFLSGNAPYVTSLLCLTPDDLLVRGKVLPLNGLKG